MQLVSLLLLFSFAAIISAAYVPPAYGLLGTYKPSRATTGHITPRDQLTNYNNPTDLEIVLRKTNEVISGKIIYGVIKRGASGIVIQDCLLKGPPNRPSGETTVVNLHDLTYFNTTIQDCTIEPQFPSSNLDGIKGHEFKAFRNHIYWVVDGFGVFTNPYDTGNHQRATNVQIAGNLVEAHAYFHGGYYSNNQAYLLTPAGTYTQYNGGEAAGVHVKRPSDGISDTIHTDGNHNDGIEIQGGYGAMSRIANGKWTGDGIYVHGNFFQTYDAEYNMQNPSGSSYTVPGQAGSLSGSILGTQDNPYRAAQSPSAPLPASGWRMSDGKYAPRGSSIIVVLNVNAFPFPSTSQPDLWTCVIQNNWVDDYASALNFPKGPYTPNMKLAVLYNHVGPHVFEWSPGSNPSTYPIRISLGASISFAKDQNGCDGLSTNTWDDPTNRFGANGSPLKPGRNSGIIYDDKYVAPVPATCNPTTPPTIAPTAPPTIAPTAEPVRCLFTTSSWQSFQLSAVQTGSFTLTFKATPALTADNAVFGIANAPQTAYASNSVALRFDASGVIQAYQGTQAVYKADNAVSYSPNIEYTFTVAVNINTQQFSASVQTAGGNTLVIASNYGFRTSATQLSVYGIIDTAVNGNTKFCQVKLNGILL